MVSTNLILFFKVAKNEILQETKEIHSIMLNKGFLIDSFLRCFLNEHNSIYFRQQYCRC